MTDTDALNARDLSTVACMPLSPHRRGWEDARYQRIYHNPYKLGSAEYWQYNDGHRDGILEPERVIIMYEYCP